MLYLKDNKEFITSNLIIPKDKKSEEMLISLKRIVNYNCSNLSCYDLLGDILNVSLLDIKKQSKLIKYGLDLSTICSDESLVIIEKVLVSNLDRNTKKYLLSKVPDFDMFYKFCNQIFNCVDVKMINRFNIDKLKMIDKMSKEIGVACEASNILESVCLAENNSKVLKIVMKATKK